MRIFRKLPGYGRPGEPAGLERTILRWTPGAALLGIVVFMGPSLLGWLQAGGSSSMSYLLYLSKYAVYAVGTLILYLNAVFMVATGALIIKLMKGPAYVADAYPLTDADRPRSISERKDEAEGRSERPDVGNGR
ncbi:hypothetical protein GSY71_12530 [Pusillimonas sp. TS35]|uniref:hypothetical protein n=1 Tax=Paracandidimonas lactea TaxID=2895524 RepID=UPI00136DDFD7|nr:hypothetical protein [Paracandidimonas lactea]MYN13964.1 hypothetical protein [Pusillimonas sp. TS35]